MDSVQALREAVEVSGLTHRQVAQRIGRNDAYVSQAMRQKSIGGDVLASIAHACGYRLELVPLDGGAPIVIGEEQDQQDDSAADRVAQARALVHRAAALLDYMEDARG